MRIFALLLCVVLATGCVPASGQWVTNIYGPHGSAIAAETSDVPESSGVVASRRYANIYWTHNDSGDYPARVYAFELTDGNEGKPIARHAGYVELQNASMIDWEDIALGPEDRVYLFDGGDNPPCLRTKKRIYRFAEPDVDREERPFELTATVEQIRFEYPDDESPDKPTDDPTDRFDSEAMWVHHESGDIYIVTKRDTLSAPTARVYRLPASAIRWNSAAVHVLEFVTDLSAVINSMSTGADIDQAGRRVVIRDYLKAYEFRLPHGVASDAFFEQSPTIVSLLIEPQGEAICYSSDGSDLITTSETRHLGEVNFWVYRTSWLLANLQASIITADRAMISWLTAEPVPSSVSYSSDSDQEQVVKYPSRKTSHQVELTDLKPGTVYRYRVIVDDTWLPDSRQMYEASFRTPSDGGADVDAMSDDPLAWLIREEQTLSRRGCFARVADGDCRSSNDLEMLSRIWQLKSAITASPRVGN